METVIQQLKIVLSTSFATYIKAQNYHWNVTGPNFAQYHEFFGEYYTAVYESVDEYAEHIRTLDAFVPGSLSRFSELSKVEDELRIQTPDVMFKNLYEANEIMRKELNIARDLADDQKLRGIVNFLEERIDYHDKMHWMIRAFIVRVSSD